MAAPVHEFSRFPRKKDAPPGGRRPRRVREEGAAPRVGVIYNPRSHRNKGQDLDSDDAPHVFISQPGNREQLPEALRQLAEEGIDLLVINGGDGTVRDVLTSGEAIFGNQWPDIAVLPKGKTNALAVDLEAPVDWPLGEAIAAYTEGRRIVRTPMKVTPLDHDDSASVLGFIFGAGVFTLAIQEGQGAHKLGAFNSLAVGVTSAWGVLQAIFGSRKNAWRQGASMDVRLEPGGAPLTHSGLGDPERRLLLFASTLERFPAGLKPFGNLRCGLKLAVLDQISRTTTLLLPFAAQGWNVKNLRQRGYHRLAAQAFELRVDEPVILDGEAFPPGHYAVTAGPELRFVAP